MQNTGESDVEFEMTGTIKKNDEKKHTGSHRNDGHVRTTHTGSHFHIHTHT